MLNGVVCPMLVPSLQGAIPPSNTGQEYGNDKEGGGYERILPVVKVETEFDKIDSSSKPRRSASEDIESRGSASGCCVVVIGIPRSNLSPVLAPCTVESIAQPSAEGASAVTPEGERVSTAALFGTAAKCAAVSMSDSNRPAESERSGVSPVWMF